MLCFRTRSGRSALGIALLLLQTLVFLAISGGLVLAAGGAALYATQQGEVTRLVDTDSLRAMDWTDFSPATSPDDTLRAIEADVAEFFARHTMAELYAIACETNLMLAPINSPERIQPGLGSLGRPSTRSPPMLRWIWLVPPQIVSDREKKNDDIIGLVG